MSRRVLGTIRSTHAIERRAHELLQRFLPLYLDEVARQQAGGGAFTAPTRPRLIARTAADRLADADLPALVVASEGTSGAPVHQQSAGEYAAAWTLRVTAVTRDADADVARELASIAAAAASAVVVQLLPDTALGVRIARWTGETVEDLEVTSGATTTLRHVCTRTLEADVADALSSVGTPPDPLDPPQDPGEFPTVATTHLTVTPVEDIEP